MVSVAGSRRRSLLLLLAWIAGSALALELGWIAAFSWAATTGRLESWVNRRPERVAVHFAAARSRWPGLIEVDGLAVRGRSRRLDWEVLADRARGQLALLPLLARHASFHAVEANGVTVRTRQRRTGAAPPGVTAAMAPMPEPAVAERRAPRAGKPRWTMVFRNVRVEGVREVHLDATRFTGEARGEGGFTIDAASSMAEVFASRLELVGGEISHRGEIVGRALAGALEARVEPWPYRELRDRRLLPKVSGRVTLTGELDDRSLIEELLRRAPWARIEPALARIDLDLRLRAGRLVDGSRLASVPVVRRMRLLDYEVEGPSGLELEVRKGEDGVSEARWAARFSTFTLSVAGDPEPLLTGTGLALAGRAPDPELAELAERTELSLALGEARLPDLARFTSWLPPSAGLELAGGSARVSGNLSMRLADRKPTGRLEAELERARLRWAGIEIEGKVALELPVVDGDLETRRLDVSGAKLRLSEFAATGTAPAPPSADAAAARGWWANVHLPRAKVRVAPPVEIEGDFEARLRDTVPFVGLFELKRDLPSWAERVLSVENVELRGRISGRPGRFELDRLESPVYGGVLKARLRFAEERRRGKLLLAWRRLAVGVGFDGADRELKVVHAQEWFDVREATERRGD